ncbi:MAG: DUF2149 domain-containing protein [Planctomycetes bacterium]|nr:DUF2149 domain-containing protein [Planctomycetota bacterium]
MRNIRRLGEETHDPLQGVANLFDVGIVFALGFLLALMTYLGLPGLVRQRDVTARNAGMPQMEIVHPDAVKLERYRMSEERLGGQGLRLGAAYRLRTGEVVCVPDEDE